ncbi:RNA polymerase sigma factor [Methylocystis bryophila]|uniref:RNA polymerase subunit sigma-24 n=1 Tax=Methylocystis bryophila TaxID=655015 RepID=A0A1W6MZZ8_9HYPH|nr:sigma-70 family RNA polymerase sigma factor [Methylocystis bryophila]ARN83119.1 RNA polymerase subunit sigma-24 [Methylocystis bryophila]
MAAGGTQSDIHRTILATWRIEQPRLIASLSRMLRDLPLAEELTQDTLVAALERWPEAGVPDRPGAWLMATAKRRAQEHLRRTPMLTRRHAMIAVSLEAEQNAMPDIDFALDDDIGDEMLRLIFTACHPLLPSPSRALLALRMICGLTTGEIARAFLLTEAAVAQRIVRAKRLLSESGLAYETPCADERAKRLPAVMEVIYLIFNEGYTAARGDHWLRPELCDEARRLGRILVSLTPEEPEVHGLVALMELNASRNGARTSPEGDPILLMEQDRRRWDLVQIRRGLNALAQAQALGGGFGFYGLQAAIAACHARAGAPEDTDWASIAEIYAQLSALTHSPVVELNRAVAVAMVAGPAAGLEIVDRLTEAPELRNYHLAPSVRGDLLERLGRMEEAHRAFVFAATLATNDRERGLLETRARRCAR